MATKARDPKKKPGRPRKAAAPREVVAVEQQVFTDEERARIAAGIAGAQGKDQQEQERAQIASELRPPPAQAERDKGVPAKTLTEQVTHYLDSRDSEAWGAAVDNRVRAEEEAERQAARLQRRERERAPKKDMRPGVAAMLAAEQARKAEMRAQAMPVARDPKTGARLPQDHVLRAPMKTSRRYTLPDTTRIDPSLIKRDESGLSFVPQWMPVEDTLGQGERSWNHIETLMAFGGEVIRKKDGSPLVSRFGVAMQQPPEDYANMTRQQAPSGAFDLDALLEPVMGAQRDLDRKRGGVSRVWKEPEHGMSRRSKSLTGENEASFADDFDDE